MQCNCSIAHTSQARRAARQARETVLRKGALEGLKVEIDTVSKGAYRCRVRLPDILFINELSSHQEEKILIQIDSLAHEFEYQPERKILNKFDVFSEIFVTPLKMRGVCRFFSKTARVWEKNEGSNPPLGLT